MPNRDPDVLDLINLIKSGVVPVGGSLVIVGGDQKVVLEAADVLLVLTSAATSADAVCSLLEIA
jgi:hypothetical protein